MHEVITVQLGQQSNYLATHFWNTQESYFTYSETEESHVDHDVHWRPGIGADGHTETFMPRTVIYDLKGGFGSMRKTNTLYTDPDENEGVMPRALWGGQTVVQRQQPIAPSAYQQSLDAGTAPPPLTPSAVRYWSDFSRVYYHPRSVVQLNEYELGSTLAPFERFAAGEELFAELDREHDLLDRDLRPFLEEADQMQGLQVLAGMDDAWGGFASRYLERLRDEYGKAPIWLWGVEGEGRGLARDKRLLRLANKARAMVEAYKQASIIVPLAVPRTLPPSIALSPTSPWQTTALLASAMESATLPNRLKDPSNRDTLGGMADGLNAMGKQSIAGLQMSFAPPPSDAAEDARAPPAAGAAAARKAGLLSEDELTEGMSLDVHLSSSLSDELDPSYRRNGFANGSRTGKVFSQLIAMRGYPPPEPEEENAGGEGVDAVGQRGERGLRRRNAYEPVTRSYTTPLRFPILSSFPQILLRKNSNNTATTTTTTTNITTGINNNQSYSYSPLRGTSTTDEKEEEDGANITTSLSTDSSVSMTLKLLRTAVARSIGLEDREMIGNDLAEMADEYHEGWSSGSDDGMDD